MKKMLNDISEKHLTALAVVVSFMCLGVLYFSVKQMTEDKPSEYVVVDMKKLILQQAQKWASDPSQKSEHEELKQLRLAALAQRIQDKIEQYATQKGVVVLNKSVVMGGKLPDITDQIVLNH